jgi:hypothetical protein
MRCSVDNYDDELERQQEFVVGGYRLATDRSVDALVVGYFDGNGLRFAAKVRAGMVPHVRADLARKLDNSASLNVPSSTCRQRVHPVGAEA